MESTAAPDGEPTAAPSGLRGRLRAALPAAIKARRTVAVAALRSALAAIDNAEAVLDPRPGDEASSGDEHVAGSVAGLRATEVERRHLTELDINAVVEREIADRRSAADRYRGSGHHDRAERLSAEAAVLSSMLGSVLAPASAPVRGGGCLLCRPDDADRELGRIEVWRDDLWRVTVSLMAPVPGFSYLEPLRHIPHITDLDGPEAATLGPMLARVTAVLKAASGSDLVYATVFDDRHAHLHVNLAPHRTATPSPVVPA
jgi:uncharacterized protein YqeY/diadenosine tetraphosphate (Ap4A) HIT family hydrolase